jgi:monoamine oxidase
MRGPDEPAAASGVDTATPLPLSELLGSRMLGQIDLTYEYQPTMFQVVGGMDNLPKAIAARLKGSITYNAAAREIRQSEQGVTVTYADKSGAMRTLEADYLVCAMPLPLLAEVDTDFTPEFKKLMSSVAYAAAGKIGLQFKRRFWEEDHQMFGGATKTDMDITQIVYPSYGFLGKKGTLVGYYLQGGTGRPIGEKTPAERLQLALEQGRQIHPQYATDFENGFSVAWHKVKWSRGSWSATAPATKAKLKEPQGRIYLAGDHLDLNAWMQGAFESARHVATSIHARAGVTTRQGAR